MLHFEAADHTYYWHEKQVPCVSNIIEHAKKKFNIPLKDLDDDKKMGAWRALWERVKVKRDWGENLHLYTAMYDRGIIDPDRSRWDERMRPMVDAWQRFKEEIIYINNLTKVVDIKSSEQPQDITGVQIAGYLRAIKETISRREIEFIKPISPWDKMIFAVEAMVYCESLKYAGTVDRIFGDNFSDLNNIQMIECCISGRGTYKHKIYSFAEYFNYFMCCYTIYNFKHGGR